MRFVVSVTAAAVVVTFLLLVCPCIVAFQAFSIKHQRQLGNPIHLPPPAANVVLLRQRHYVSRVIGQAAISAGDTVLIVGGTGGLGQLVTKKLLQLGDYKVRITSRDVQRGKDTIGDDRVDVVKLDLTSSSSSLSDTMTEQLQAALGQADDHVAAIVISVGTTAFPTTKWAGGNTPEAIDKIAVTNIANIVSTANTTASKGLKRIILITSIGVERTKEMPFAVLNLFGVLDAKRSGEEAIQSAAAQQRGGTFDYVIVRPGRLVGGPWTNLDVAKLLQVEGGAENGVKVERGDSLLGDCKRDACAEAIVQALLNEECSNIAFSIVSTDEPALTNQQWKNEFQRMSQLTPQT